MTNKNYFVAGMTTTLLSIATVAGAQDYSGATTIGYGNTSVEGLDNKLNVLSLDGEFDAKFDNGFDFGASISLNNGHVDDIAQGVTASAFGIEGGYSFGNNFSAGAYIEKAQIDVEEMDIDLSATSFGLSGAYSTDTVTFKAFVGATKTNPDLPDDVNLNDIGLAVGYNVTPNLTVAGSIINSRLSDNEDNVNLQTAGVAAVFGFSESFTLFAGLSDTSLDLVDVDFTAYGVGVSYDLLSVVNFRSSVSLELARSTIGSAGDSVDFDTVRIGFTIPIGRGNVKVPSNSVAGAIMDPRHSAVSTVVLSTF